MMVVSHEMGFARAAADRVVFMDEGQIIGPARPTSSSPTPRKSAPSASWNTSSRPGSGRSARSSAARAPQSRLQVGDAAGVGADDHARRPRGEGLHLEVAQLLRQLRFQDGVGAGRATAHVAIGTGLGVKPAARSRLSTAPRICWPCCSVQGLWKAVETPCRFLRVPSSRAARGSCSPAITSLRSRTAAATGQPWAHRPGRPAAGGRIAHMDPQPEAVMTMASAPASSRGSQASMRRRASSRAACTSLRWNRPRRSTHARRLQQRDAQAVQHPGRRRVDVGVHRGLHAAGELDHLARVLGRGAGSRPAVRGPWPGGPAAAAGAPSGPASGPRRRDPPGAARPEDAPEQPVAPLARHLPIHHLAADVQQPRIVHPRGAGGLAGAAVQAAVQVHWVLAVGSSPSSTDLMR